MTFHTGLTSAYSSGQRELIHLHQIFFDALLDAVYQKHQVALPHSQHSNYNQGYVIFRLVLTVSGKLLAELLAETQ